MAGLSAAQKHDIEQVLQAILDARAPRKSRQLAAMFLDLVNRDEWPEYYEVIPDPRCINGVKESLEKNKYKDPLVVYRDLNLVFLNAMYYNEEGSQISKDARTLQSLLDTEWRRYPSLPTPLSSPPTSSLPTTRRGPAQSQPQPQPQTSNTIPHPTSRMRATGSKEPSTPNRRTTPLPSRGTPKRGGSKQPQSSSSTSILPTIPASPGLDVDVEIDIGGTPEPDSLIPVETTRDGDSDEIVRQLERGLPRWEGFEDIGFMKDVNMEKCKEILMNVLGYTDASGIRPAATLESIPTETNIPDLGFTTPLSLSTIQNKLQNNEYPSSEVFDKEMTRLFLKGRRFFEPTTEPYGNVITAQRLYQALTSPTPPAGPPFQTTTYFASLRAGPGTAKPIHASESSEGIPGVTSVKLSTKNRTLVDEVVYKGMRFRLGEWVHLMNPDDSKRPIVAQIFKCWVNEEPSKKGQLWISVCWYFRPEQTWHPAHRQFWDREVFKTSHMADHPLSDILEKIACQFMARHIRGRPRPPFWYLGFPLYVCESRYNDSQKVFVKIKSWNSCVPEEVRKNESYMPIFYFERNIFPRKVGSPFLVKGRGGAASSSLGVFGIGSEAFTDNIGGDGTNTPGTGTAARKRSTRRAAAANASSSGQIQTRATGTTSSIQTPAQGRPGSATILSRPGGYHHQHMNDKSIVAAAGGFAVLGGHASLEELSGDIAKYFDKDPNTNQVLWFAAPPIDLPHPSSVKYSLEYLHFLAMGKKRKRQQQLQSPQQEQLGGSSDVRSIDQETPEVVDTGNSAKRIKTTTTSTMTERVEELIKECGVDEVLENIISNGPGPS
ncbi:hypothetical protein C8Q75DRAFT_886490 [Abortiporus biennis]|nr:hypothetical protein C8Q75DRAFT_886490 [Abortiporus biennis]